ncbi:MAG: alpha/beta hydrolase fold domain-containing protein [Clostridia bacterium]|nr:alpha/beta hydrolase fold domain-containing protein [Clostridia bacterium]
MALSMKFVRRQLELFKPFSMLSSLENARKGQEILGSLMAKPYRKEVAFETHRFENFEGIWCLTKDETREGVVLYLHGGGYCCGDKTYARGVGASFAARYGIKVFSVAYRLAPEHPYPAALTDALDSYLYLLSVGFAPEQILLCGESAGGGLAFSLCAMLRERGMAMPAGILTMSPWTDLTASGASYVANAKKDPSMVLRRLRFFASHYAEDLKNPLVSPLFGNVTGFPPTLTFVGGDEIMLDDAVLMHEKLIKNGVDSELIVANGCWHAYPLYDLRERAEDYARIEQFLRRVMAPPRKLRWMSLDNAAKIYPAARSRNWSNAFRLSASLFEKVDVDVLRTALDVTARRFPGMAVRLGTGAFWYYLEELSHLPDIGEDYSYPLKCMQGKDIHTCAFRVLVYGERIALEIFHAITDGNGGLIFLKTLLAEYIKQKYGTDVPATDGVLDRREAPAEEEFADCFLRHAGEKPMSRKEENAFLLRGTPEKDGFVNLTVFSLSASQVHGRAKAEGVSVTAYLTAALMQAVLRLQAERVPNRRRRAPVKILLPVNLRSLFPSKTLRNFVLFVTPGVDPRMGDYTFSQLCKSVHHQMGTEITPQRMAARIATNVNSEKLGILRVTPLFIKNIVMKMIFNAVGERKCCLTFSNLGVVRLPEEMRARVKQMDFVLSPPHLAYHNASAISYGDELRMTFVRSVEESALESAFYQVLREQGIHAKVESNLKK